MAEIIGVRFKNVGKIYYFDPDGKTLQQGDRVIVETARGVECGEVAVVNRDVPAEEIAQPLKKLIRVAKPEDLDRMRENAEKEKTAFDICCKKIEAHKLDMKLVEVEYTFDNSKILFYFTADGRVDFRELVKDLASVFRTRIELRQIGVRDEAKMLGGLGTCGRLMCCLKYEQEAYADLLRSTPSVNSLVQTPDGRGTVISQNLLTGVLQVRLDGPDGLIKNYQARQVKVLRQGRVAVDKNELEQLKELEKN